jgi:hypothetical protein
MIHVAYNRIEIDHHMLVLEIIELVNVMQESGTAYLTQG